MVARRLRVGTTAAAVHITQVDYAVDASNLTTYTFAAMDLGAAVSGRKSIVGVAHRAVGSTITVNSVTIDGVSATQQASANDTTDTNTTHASIWSAATPSANTTGDVVVVFSSGAVRCGINVWKMTGAAAVNATAIATSVNSGAGDISLTIPTNGAVCAFSAGVGFGSWVGITECLTPQDIEGGFYMSGAMQDHTTGGGTAMFHPNLETTACATWGP